MDMLGDCLKTLYQELWRSLCPSKNEWIDAETKGGRGRIDLNAIIQ